MPDKYKYRAVDFDTFSSTCPHAFTFGKGYINNGYNCAHKDQNHREPAGGNGRLSVGCCFGFSCPLGTMAEPQDILDPDSDDAINSVDWNGHDDPEELEDQVLLCDTDQTEALYAYDLYMYRYDKSWLDAHGIENSLCD